MKNFEEKMNRLEEINQSIKGDDMDLEQAVSLFEEGLKLSENLGKQLSDIEQKIEILINPPQEGGKPEFQLFSDEKT